jgi:hypothetical protein
MPDLITIKGAKNHFYDRMIKASSDKKNSHSASLFLLLTSYRLNLLPDE